MQRHGADTVLGSVRRARTTAPSGISARCIRDIADGRYAFEHHLDNDGQVDEPLDDQARSDGEGDTIRFDFTGSSPPVRGAINVPRMSCIAACQIAIKHLFPEVPINGGCFRPFEYVIPPTTFLGVEYPHAISGYLESIGRVVSTVIGALNPGAARPGAGRLDQHHRRGHDVGPPPANDAYYVDALPRRRRLRRQCRRRRPRARPSALGSANYPSVESVEHRLPIRIDSLALRTNSGGAGRHRGGCGTRYAYRSLADGVAVAVLGDQHTAARSACSGGEPGGGADVLFHDDVGEHRLPMRSKGLRTLNRGEVLEYSSPGGGGYGPPHERPPEAGAARRAFRLHRHRCGAQTATAVGRAPRADRRDPDGGGARRRRHRRRSGANAARPTARQETS